MAQRRTVQGAFGNEGTMLFDGIAADRKTNNVRRQAERQQDRDRREMEKFAFYSRQSVAVLKLQAVTGLSSDSLARKVAEETIRRFAVVRLTKDCKISRTRYSFECALAVLGKTLDDAAKSRAIRLGKTAAYKALSQAYTALKAEKPYTSYDDQEADDKRVSA
jgi:uncharacterized protein YqfB (UPF0267 family)